MKPIAVIAFALALGCAADPPSDPDESEAWTVPHAPWNDPQPQPPAPARFRDPAAARYHMRAHFNDLREIEQLLVAGKLDDGRTRAYLLTREREIDEPGLASWSDRARDVVDAATTLTKASKLDDALRREAQVAVACARCHAATQSRLDFAAAPVLPADRQTARTRMARHVWAVDRLWEGLVGADDARWSRGLAVLADDPLPFTPATDAPRLASELQQLARAQLDKRATTLLEDRGAAYGEMLVRCAACHASVHAGIH
ncbi:MAG TPA: hypothetical protein VMJ10_06575 [Kofleriaceae bacterium]|nr:hypothetical protein [Kofleriaceae bacterium]